MITEQVVLEGRNATVCWLMSDFSPSENKESSTLVKILFDDGELRFAVPAINSNFLDASDVHIEGPLQRARPHLPFKVCTDCSGSTAPTCKKNRKCLGKP